MSHCCCKCTLPQSRAKIKITTTSLHVIKTSDSFMTISPLHQEIKSLFDRHLLSYFCIRQKYPELHLKQSRISTSIPKHKYFAESSQLFTSCCLEKIHASLQSKEPPKSFFCWPRKWVVLMLITTWP